MQLWSLLIHVPANTGTCTLCTQILKRKKYMHFSQEKNEKGLLCDGHKLTVKPYDHYDNAQQWTLDGEYFITPKKDTHSWHLRVKAFQVVCLTRHISCRGFKILSWCPVAIKLFCSFYTLWRCSCANFCTRILARFVTII